MTRVRIGIVSWNTASLLDRCLQALPDATRGLMYDVVVVDNDSSDDSVPVARAHDNVMIVVNETNVGYAKAMNQAFQLDVGGQSPDVLIALNPDTEPPPGSLSSLVERLMNDDTVGLVVPQLANVGGTLQHSVYRFPSSLLTCIICSVPVRLQKGRLAEKWWLEGRVPHNQTCDIDWAIGAVHVIRASSLGGELPYCERWFMYAEDMDLCWRLKEGGWLRRLEADVTIRHVGNAAGRQVWTEQTAPPWWGPTYDWYRLRRGVPAVRRWAAVNTIGVAKLLGFALLRKWIAGGRIGAFKTARIADLRRALPLHVAMWRAPRTTYQPGPSDQVPR
jgi:GT2 family glycosyltransferase